MNCFLPIWKKDPRGNFLQVSFLVYVKVFQGPGTQGPAPKIEPANWEHSWSLGRNLLFDQAFTVRAGIRSSLGSPGKP